MSKSDRRSIIIVVAYSAALFLLAFGLPGCASTCPADGVGCVVSNAAGWAGVFGWGGSVGW